MKNAIKPYMDLPKLSWRGNCSYIWLNDYIHKLKIFSVKKSNFEWNNIQWILRPNSEKGKFNLKKTSCLMYSNNRFFVRKIKQTFYKHFSYVIKLILKYFYGLTLLLFLPSPRNAWRMTMKGLNGFLIDTKIKILRQNELSDF